MQFQKEMLFLPHNLENVLVYQMVNQIPPKSGRPKEKLKEKLLENLSAALSELVREELDQTRQKAA